MSKKVIKLSAEWCGPCKQYAPIFMSLMDDLESGGWEVSMVDIDTDGGKEIAKKHGIRSVPTTLVLEDGKDDVIKTGSLDMVALKNLLSL